MVFSRARVTLAALAALLAIGAAPAVAAPVITSPSDGAVYNQNGAPNAAFGCIFDIVNPETATATIAGPGIAGQPPIGNRAPLPDTIAGGPYTLTLTCTPETGSPSQDSASYTIRDVRPPGVPTPGSPGGGTPTLTGNPIFSWSAVSDNPGGVGGVQYRIQVSGPPSFQIPFQAGTSYLRPTGLPDGGSYSWRVRSRDAAGNESAWSDPGPAPWLPFRIDNTDPPVPTLLTPGGGILINDRTPTFDWTAVTDGLSNPVTYKVNLVGPGGAVVATPDFGAATEYTPLATAPLVADGTYTWSVSARDATGAAANTSTSPGRNFTLDGTPPGPITITATPPSPSTNPNPSFSWTPGEVGASFAWQVVDSNGNVVKNGNTGATTLKVSALPAGLLSFRVWQVDAAGNAGPAAEAKFRITNPPPPSSPLPKPQIRNAKRLKPKAGYEVSTATVTLRWYRPTKDTVLYNVQLFLMSKNGKTLTKVHSAFPRGTSYKVPARTFKNRINRRFVWQVWAYRGQAKGYLSRPIGITYFDKLRTKSPPKFLAPTASRLTAGKKQLVRWRKAPKTNYYQVLVFRGDRKIVSKRSTRVRYTIPASRLRPNFTYRIVILRGLGPAKAKARYASKAWTGKKLTVVPPPRKV